MNFNNETIIAIIESDDSCLKAKILILLWKELASQYPVSDWETLDCHIYYRALAKIPEKNRRQAFEELVGSDETEYLSELLSRKN